MTIDGGDSTTTQNRISTVGQHLILTYEWMREMPININLLLLEDDDGGSFARLLESQIQRYPSIDADQHETALRNVKEEAQTRRSKANLLELQQRELKSIQQMLSPKSSASPISDPAIRDQMRTDMKAKKAAIQVRQEEVRLLEASIDKQLLSIANLLDGDDLTISANQQDVPGNLRTMTSQVDDPLFCIGGYTTLEGKDITTTTVLTGYGAEMVGAIATYAAQCFKTQDSNFISCPNLSTMSTDGIHSILGCQGEKCRICCGECSLPGHIVASLLHRDRVYWDKELPVRTVFKSSHHEVNRTTTCHLTRKWFANMPSEQIGMLGLSTCLVEESRQVQNAICETMLSFFESLLVPASRKVTMLRRRTVFPSELLAHEANRINIEGFILGNYVMLGYVSNSLDFVSKALNIRCGGVNVEYVHVVQASCRPSTEIIEWIAQNSVMEHDGHHGIGIPSVLVRYMGKMEISIDDVLFVPFQRRLQKGKAGRKPAVKELPYSEESIIRQSHGRQQNRTAKAKEKRPIFALDRMPTAREVREEKFISPFDFLPLA